LKFCYQLGSDSGLQKDRIVTFFR